MNMKVRILRKKSPDAESYWETFEYNGPENNSIAGVLDYLNYHDDPVNTEGKVSERITWACSCMQGVCGACAMVINGVPALACETFLRDLKGDEIVLEPLRKFPAVVDLAVDRSSIQENLKKTDIYIGEYSPAPNEDHAHQYAAAKCMKCGLCLEVCPNYVNGNTFYGAAFANDCYLIYARNKDKAKDIKKAYGEHFGAGCSKSLSCVDVCPAGIPTLASMARMNR